MCSSPPARTPKLQLAVKQPLTKGCWNPAEEDTTHPKTKKKPHIQRQRRNHTSKNEEETTHPKTKKKPHIQRWRRNHTSKDEEETTHPKTKKKPHIQRQRRNHTSKDKEEEVVRWLEGCNQDKIKSYTHRVGDSQTGEQYQRSSPTLVKVLHPPSGFPAWGSSKGTRNP